MSDDGEVTTAAPPGRPMWSGTISFGLVSVPVMLLPAVRSGGVRMHMLAEDGTPLSRRYYCPADGREVHPEHILRGYEVEKDKYVVVRDEEIEALAPDKSRDIDLRRFVDLADVDPIYFDRAYFLMPGSETNKAYRLLAETMEKSGKAGIATFVMRDKEYLVAIIAEAGILRAETMRFHDEVRSPEDVGLPDPVKVSKADTQKVEKAIRKLTEKTLDLSELEDDYTERVMKLVEKKSKQDKDVVETEEAAADEEVESLVAALKASMAKTQKKRK